jgi:hypothetical protein
MWRALRNALKQVVTAVRGKERPSVVPGFLRPIDTGAVARQLNLKEVGSERGMKQLPATGDPVFDAVEQTIIQRVVSEWTWQGGELINNLRAYAERLIGFSVRAEQAQLVLAAKNALTRLQEASIRAVAQLGPLKEAYLAARKELDDFRKRHRLERPARNPGRRWTTFGLLFVLIGVESALNGFFFAKGSEFGLIGGVGTAIGISATNVIFAFLLGLWPARLINRRNIFVRTLALLVTIAGIAGLIALHAFAAHFRDATALVGEDRALQTAIDTLKQAPWAVADINSAYLFGLGVLFGLGAFWKGYTFDDPYPGYGPVSRRAESAREAYSDEHHLLFDDLEAEKEDTVEKLREGIARIPDFPQKAGQIRMQRAALLETFRAYEGSVELAANQLLEIYRGANKSSRTTPAPAHFGEAWKLPHSFLSGREMIDVTPEPETTSPEEISAIVAELDQHRDAVLSEYMKMIKQHPHPTDMQ